MDPEKLLSEIGADCDKAIAEAADTAALAAVRVAFLGKNGRLTALLRNMKDIPPEARPAFGKRVNDVRAAIEDKLSQAEAAAARAELDARLAAEAVDITLPGVVQRRGCFHPQTVVRQQIADIFAELGFTVEDGPEIETDYYNFEALNIPSDHPARESQDTFYIDGGFLLRSQTSTTQVHVMERGVLPIKMISPGRVYRADDVDATHSPMFHQIEGLVIDRGITLCDLRGVLDLFTRKFFGEQTKTRWRPSYFPFTEPSIEMDATCAVCGGKGCSVCKGTGWIEIMGAGMVNRRVLAMSGIDPDRYTGFAFGMGLDRITNIKYGINDLRVVFENDVRFLKQFK